MCIKCMKESVSKNVDLCQNCKFTKICTVQNCDRQAGKLKCKVHSSNLCYTCEKNKINLFLSQKFDAKICEKCFYDGDVPYKHLRQVTPNKCIVEKCSFLCSDMVVCSASHGLKDETINTICKTCNKNKSSKLVFQRLKKYACKKCYVKNKKLFLTRKCEKLKCVRENCFKDVDEKNNGFCSEHQPENLGRVECERELIKIFLGVKNGQRQYYYKPCRFNATKIWNQKYYCLSCYNYFNKICLENNCGRKTMSSSSLFCPKHSVCHSCSNPPLHNSSGFCRTCRKKAS